MIFGSRLTPRQGREQRQYPCHNEQGTQTSFHLRLHRKQKTLSDSTEGVKADKTAFEGFLPRHLWFNPVAIEKGAWGEP
jgi:hypothetical protein